MAFYYQKKIVSSYAQAHKAPLGILKICISSAINSKSNKSQQKPPKTEF